MSHSQERRVRTSASLRARTSNNGGTVVEGYALTYGTRTLIGRGKGSFHEVLSPGAARKASKGDVRLLFNHQGMPLARTKSGTLSLREDPTKGVFFSAQLDADSSPDAQALASAINRGDIDGCSFSFRVADNGDTWDDFDCDDSETCCGQRGSVLRTINEIGEMFDVSCVSFPAYPGTSVSGQPVEDLSRQNVASAEVRNRAEQIIEQRGRKPRLSDAEWFEQAARKMVAAHLAIRADRAYSVRDAVDALALQSQTALDAAHAEDVRFAEANRIARQAARWLAAPHTFPGDCASFLRWQEDWFRS